MSAEAIVTVPVGAVALRRIEELPAQIFTATGDRWGWEARQPAPIAVVPDAAEPVGVVPAPAWARRVVRLRRRVRTARVWLMLGAVGLFLAYLINGFITLLETSGVARASDRVMRGELFGRYFSAHPFVDDPGNYLAMGGYWLLAATACCLGGWFVLPRWQGWRSLRGQHAWMVACRDSLNDYLDGFGRWYADRQAAYERHAARIATLPQWVPLRSASDGRLDVYGGTSRGWSCLLVTAGTALVGSGSRVTVLDLSREQVVRPLVRLAGRHRRAVRTVRLPADADTVNLLAGLDPDEVVDALVDAVHAGEPVSPETRSLDARILHDVCALLSPELTLNRVRAALGVLQQAEPPRDGAPLTLEEFERISDMFGQARRSTAESRVTALEARLHELRRCGSGAGEPVLDSESELCVVEVGEHGGDATAGMLASLLLAQHAHRERNALIVAGADLLPRTQLDRLDRVARRHDVRLVYLFRHIRDDAEHLLGTGGPVIVMRVGNAKEAAAATEYIGREYRFVLHQLTINAGTGTSDSTTHTETTGSQDSLTRAGLLSVPVANTSGTSESTATGTTGGTSTSFTEAVGRQRSHEPSVTPVELQKLPETAFFLIDPERRSGPRARSGDCNPWLITAPGVTDQPALLPGRR